MISQFCRPQRGHKSLKDLWNRCVLHMWGWSSSFLSASFCQSRCRRRREDAGARWRQPVTGQRRGSWFECRLHDPLLPGEIGGNDRADGARDITNPIINSLSFGLDTLFVFISWYLSLVFMHFVFIKVAHVKAERSSMNICWICSSVSCRKRIASELSVRADTQSSNYQMRVVCCSIFNVSKSNTA